MGSLGNYGGPTQTIALLPGSPAINAGTAIGAPTTDQRDVPRIGTVDIGAFESRGFALNMKSGNNQNVAPNAAFAPLVVTVTSAFSEPVDGGKVTFTGPSSGAGIVISPVVVTVASGQASITPTANTIAGSNYPVTAAVATGTTPASISFTLSNTAVDIGHSYIVTTTDDTPTDANCTVASCTLRQAINASNINNPGAGNQNTINYMSGVSGLIVLGNDANHGTLRISQSVTITGPATGAGVTVSGGNAVRVFNILPGTTATISNLTVANGDSGNTGAAGIYNQGTLTLTNCTLSGNSAHGGGNGGGIFNSGTLTVTNSTLFGNSAGSGGFGGGIGNVGTLTVINSTLSGNSAHFGGGIYNQTTGANGTVNLLNTIVAGNIPNPSYPDIFGAVTSLGHNLIGDTVGSSGIVNGINGDIVTPSPLLAPLSNYGGMTRTMALLPGSPAIGAGEPSGTGVPTTDQRAVARTGHNDIGAFQSRGFTLTGVSGTPQSKDVGAAFAPLAVSVTSDNGEPVGGGQVTYCKTRQGGV